MKENLTIGFIGNPNCGKTTLFNAYTGANLKVANWPGVTVEKVEGAIRDHNLNIRLVDLPGTYSLTSYTMEEQVSRQFILSDEVDMIIDVVDASALERNLYLTLQLLELGKPVVMALNMMDIVEKRGMEIDTHRLPEMLGIPVIPVSARKRTGLDVLLHAAAHHKDCNDPQCLVHHHKDQSSHDGDKDFAFGIHCIDGLFFKQNRYVHVLELPYVFQAVQCVSGKSADGLGNDHINVTGFAVINHTIEFFSLFGVGAGYTVISINSGKFPIRIFLNVLCVVLDLSFITCSLLIVVCTDAAVRCDSEFWLFFFLLSGVASNLSPCRN